MLTFSLRALDKTGLTPTVLGNIQCTYMKYIQNANEKGVLFAKNFWGVVYMYDSLWIVLAYELVVFDILGNYFSNIRG